MTLARQIDRNRTVTQYLKAVGVLTTLQLGRQRVWRALDLPVPRSIQVRPAGVRYPLIMRTEPSSDGAVFWEVFLRRVYARQGRRSVPQKEFAWCSPAPRAGTIARFPRLLLERRKSIELAQARPIGRLPVPTRKVVVNNVPSGSANRR